MDTRVFFLMITLAILGQNVTGQNVTKSHVMEDPANSTISITVKLSSLPSTSPEPSTVTPSILDQVINGTESSVPVTTQVTETPKATTTTIPVLGDNRPPQILPCEMNTVTSTTNDTINPNVALVQCYDHNNQLVTIGVTTLNLAQTNIQSTQVKTTTTLDMKSLAIIVVGYVAFLCVIAVVGVAGVLVVACQQGVNRRSRCQAGYQTIV